MNDRPYRNDRSNNAPRDRNGRDDHQRGGHGRSDRPKRDYDRSDRSQGSYQRRDEQRPQRSGYGRDHDDRRPSRGGYGRDEQRPQRPSYGRDGRPQRDDRDGRSKSPNYGRGGTRGDNRSDRGGRDREFTEAERLQHELRPVRASHIDPVIPDEIEPKDLHPAARNELKTLQADIQERVARHLAMVAFLIEEDPELAHQHALSASRRAGRIPVTRETLAITAYRTGDFALALRELRTYRRLSGLDTHVALMVDCERGLGRPERAVETGLAADTSKLDTEQRVHLAIAMSGARLDLGQTQQALYELEIPELNPAKAFSWSSHLFGAYAAVLEDLGRTAEAAEWAARSEQAAIAVQNHVGALDAIEVFEIYETEEAPNEDVAPETELEADRSAEHGIEAEVEPDSAPHEGTETVPDIVTPNDAVDTSDGAAGFDRNVSIEAEVDELLAEAGIIEDEASAVEHRASEHDVSEQSGDEQEKR